MGVLALGVLPVAPAEAQTSDAAAQKAALEITAARDKANRAAEAWVKAETELDNLSVEQTRLEEETKQLSAHVDELQAGVESLALDRFLGDSNSAGLFIGLDGPTQQVEADILARLASDTSETSIDNYQAAQADLVKKQAELSRKQKQTGRAAAAVKKTRDDALVLVEQLKKIEAQRLKDEAVRRALEALLAEQQRRDQEKAAREAKVAEALAKAQAAAAAPAPAAASQGSTDQGAQPAPAADAPKAGSSGSSSASGATTDPGAGTTGGGGTPGDGGGAPITPEGDGSAGGAYVDHDIICPVQGSAYGDTWGAPRSGGRRHQGVDMLATLGTPLYAVASGDAQFRQNELGGNAIWLRGDNGNSYYYAHLDHYEGDSRHVSQGEVVGYVGDTGNARGTPHLHFEVHPGNGPAVNPTPTVRAAGC